MSSSFFYHTQSNGFFDIVQEGKSSMFSFFQKKNIALEGKGTISFLFFSNKEFFFFQQRICIYMHYTAVPRPLFS